jgi:hypothetical protein
MTDNQTTCGRFSPIREAHQGVISYDRQAIFLKKTRQTVKKGDNYERQLLTGKKRQIAICVMGQK